MKKIIDSYHVILVLITPHVMSRVRNEGNACMLEKRSNFLCFCQGKGAIGRDDEMYGTCNHGKEFIPVRIDHVRALGTDPDISG